jgi:glyoxylase I family protein
VKATGLHHVTIRVQDPQATRLWYQKVLGLEFIELPVDERVTGIWRGRPSSGAMLVTQLGACYLVFAPPLEGTSADDKFSEYRIGIDHLAIGVNDRSELDALVTTLLGAGVSTEGVEHDHVLDRDYVAFRDPDNIQWEAYVV